jgi:hypothetical protein
MMNESNYIRDGRENSSIPRYLHWPWTCVMLFESGYQAFDVPA